MPIQRRSRIVVFPTANLSQETSGPCCIPPTTRRSEKIGGTAAGTLNNAC
ncbi:MAG: hypothetical protein OJF52_001177 [Nitrospira sp.]|jgi:hypothetical protein|nr:MAG: hypothetical protein OJF52_001177 [Nitrospira sp.]